MYQKKVAPHGATFFDAYGVEGLVDNHFLSLEDVNTLWQTFC